jgi:dTMP kinase
MAFIVIEGIDGSGKSTQLKKILEFLEQTGARYKYIHFPRTDSPVYGDLISRFLRGDFGDLKSVNPYLVALIYAGDRYDARLLISEWLDAGFLVIADRYVYSNVAFQCAKYDDEEERRKLWDWILYMEYQYNRIPKPDLNIFLDVPFEFTREQLSLTRKGYDRDYLNGRQDIHEENLDFQKKVKEVYHSIALSAGDVRLINCSGTDGKVLSPDQIFILVKQQIMTFIPG